MRATHTYDAVFSLGINCAAAGQMQIRGLRQGSGPLDWIYCSKPEALFDNLKRWFTNDFSDFLTHPLTLLNDEVDILGNLCYVDNEDGYIYPHDFETDPITPDQLAAVQTRYRRRGKRLCETLRSGGKYLFVITRANSTLVADEVRDFILWLRAQFTASTIDCLFVEHASKTPAPTQEIAPGIYVNRPKKRFRFRRELRWKSKSFVFLDSVRLTLMDDEAAWAKAKINEKQKMLVHNRALALRIPLWKQMDRKALGEVRTLLINNYQRGLARFPHLPRWDRFLIWCFIFLRWHGAIKRLPTRPGLTAPQD